MAFSTTDTIVAIATPPGRGGIGVVRLSGPHAARIARALITRSEPLEARRATFTKVRLTATTSARTSNTARPDAHERGDDVDHVVATFFPAPHSYTGDDVVELSAHGSPVVLRAIVGAALAEGARAAEPGEFTLRAFLNGRIDLPQAEAVADLINAATPLQARAAFDQLQGTLTRQIGALDSRLFDLIAKLEASIDFPDEGYHFIGPGAIAQELDELIGVTEQLLAEARRGRVLREGLEIAIVGRPNVGKSSLFNALAGAARAIVSEVPGTTRDLITEEVDLDGLRVLLVDTAGLRSTSDAVEAEGVFRSKGALAVADLTLLVLDGSQPLEEADIDIISQVSGNKHITVKSKSDLSQEWRQPADVVEVSAVTGSGLSELRRRIVTALDVDLQADRPTITNVRHIELVRLAHDALIRARDAASSENASLSEEFVLADLQHARNALEEVTGTRTSDDLLAHVFSRFCVGK